MAADKLRLASEAFEDGDFQRSSSLYKSIVESNALAPDLFYNIGNTAYRLGNEGEAALWFRRALALEPSHAEATHNLRVIEQRNGAISTRHDGVARFVQRFTYNQLVLLASIGFWGSLLSFLVSILMAKRSPRIKYAFSVIAVRAVCLLLLTFSIVSIALQRTRSPIEDRAVVVSNRAMALTGPFGDAEEVIPLPAGTQVNVLNSRDAWTFIGIGDDIRGWIRAEALAPLWPYDPAFLH
ncbi:MAG: tetratricopeptide repeat protein [Verrucomicrobiota bacterium]